MKNKICKAKKRPEPKALGRLKSSQRSAIFRFPVCCFDDEGTIHLLFLHCFFPFSIFEKKLISHDRLIDRVPLVPKMISVFNIQHKTPKMFKKLQQE